MVSRVDKVRRLARTVAVFSRCLGPPMLRRRRDPADVTRGLRRAFEELGATYVKFGQLVGSSPGAFGKATSDEFRSCLDTGPAVPFDEVRRVVEESTGQRLESTFPAFERTPIAAASIAVVHRATLADGAVVAVKVLRPGIADVVATDLDIMQPVFRFLALRGIPVAGPLYRFLSGFRRQIAEEVDLRNEAEAMAHFRKLFDGVEELAAIVVPEPNLALTTRDVCVMEYLDGVPIDDLEAIAAMGHDATPLVQALLRSWFLTGLRDGMFHGDIHAGNMLLLRDGRLGMVDWGIVGRLDEDTRHVFRRFVEAVLGDASAWQDVAEFMRRAVPVPEELRPVQSDEARDREIREIELMLTRPFGEVDLTGSFSGPQFADANGVRPGRRERMRRLRAFRKVIIKQGVADSGFAHADFLLFKQLLYFERYGKMYLADAALLGDRDYLQKVLAETPAVAT